MVLATDAPPLDTSKLRYDYDLVAEEHRQRVIEAAVDILANGRRAKESIIAMGQRLIEVKSVLPEGTFTAWITTEFELSDRMAQNYMNVARQYGERPEIISVLNDTILYLLAAPSTPEPARLEVEALAIAEGRSPKVETAKRVIAAHRPERPAPTPPPAKVVYLEPAAVPHPPEPSTETYETEAASAFDEEWDSGIVSSDWVIETLVRSRNFDDALRCASEKECLRALTQIPQTDKEADRRSRIEARLEQLRMADEITAALPNHLLDAHYELEQLHNGLWRWQHTLAKGHYHVGHPKETPALAIEDALKNYKWQTELGNIGKVAPLIDIKPAKTPDPRIAQAQSLRTLLIQARDRAKAELLPLTGTEDGLIEFDRGIRRMIPPLDDLIAILLGNSGEGDGA